MSIELLTNNEFNNEVKELVEHLDEIESKVDIYSILVDEQVLLAAV